MVMIFMRIIKAVIKQRKNTRIISNFNGKRVQNIYSKNVNYRTQ